MTRTEWQREHPTVSTIAAMVDGRLSDPERDWLIGHLGDCDNCYQLFADTSRVASDLKREEGRGEECSENLSPDASGPSTGRLLRPPRSRWRRPAVLTGALAAAVLAALLLAPLVARFVPTASDPPSVERLALALSAPGELATVIEGTWNRQGWPLPRGGEGGTPEAQRSFRIGVHSLELELALVAGRAQLARELTLEIERLAEPQDAGPLRALFGDGSGIRGRLEAGAAPPDLLALSRRADALLSDGEVSWYHLGKWARAAQLAAASGDEAFFATRRNRHFVEEALRLTEFSPTVAEPLRRTKSLIERGPAGHLHQIERELHRVLTVGGGGRSS